MGYYVVPGNQGSLTTSAKTCVNTTGGATPRRHKLSEIVMGAVGNPNATDTALTFDVVRLGGAGAGSVSTAFTPNPNDPADAACSTVAGINNTSEGSVISTSTLAFFPINQRNTVRWVAVQESQMFIMPATTSSGAAVRCLAASGGFTASVAATVTFME